MNEYVLHRLPAWAPMYGITLGHHIFLKDVADTKALLHELVHVRQQREHPLWFWVSYLALLPFGWNPWRTRWEAEAYAEDVTSGRLRLSEAATILSGALYLWPCTYRGAWNAIDKCRKA